MATRAMLSGYRSAAEEKLSHRDGIFGGKGSPYTSLSAPAIALNRPEFEEMVSVV